MNRTDRDESATRRGAGRALMIFLLIMAALTLLSNTLREMVVPIVSPTLPQRGSLEYRINADGTLGAAGVVAVMGGEAGRVTEIIAKVGQKVAAGDALLRVDYKEVLAERHAALIEAIDKFATERQNFNWAKADISTDSLSTLESRRKSLATAEQKRDDAQAVLDELAQQGAEETETKRAQSKLKTAQDSVDYYKRRLEQYTTSREYMRTQKLLNAAEVALGIAWREYFAAYAVLDGALNIDQNKLREAVIRHVEYGGSAAEMISFHPNAVYMGTVCAPSDGEILSVDAKLGETMSESAPVITISDAQKGYSLVVTISGDEASRMIVGEKVEVLVGEEYVFGEIVSIRTSSEGSGQCDVELHIDAEGGAIGLRGSMRYSAKSASYDVLIPLTALRKDSQGEFVYLIEQQSGSLGSSLSVRRVDVHVLDRDSSRAALQGGVSQRDMLVMRSERELSDGDRVRMKEGT